MRWFSSQKHSLKILFSYTSTGGAPKQQITLRRAPHRRQLHINTSVPQSKGLCTQSQYGAKENENEKAVIFTDVTKLHKDLVALRDEHIAT